jgi:ELWxxDGT repeat protein
MPSLTPALLSDINPGVAASNPGPFTQVNDLVFFPGNDGVHGAELWADNLTGGAAFLVRDINSGSAGSYPTLLTNVNGTLFFAAADGALGNELWASNGTAAGTHLVKDINPGNGGASLLSLTNVNGRLFFDANDGSHGTELWASNGTAAGTALVHDINPGAAGSDAAYLTNVNGSVFFSATDGSHGTELWASNGAAAGTFLVRDINPGASSSSPHALTNVSGTLFFATSDGTNGTELWKSNGTAAGTVMVADINPGSGSSYPAYLTNVNGTLFFSADDGTNGTELWRSNGAAAGTFQVANIAPVGRGSNPHDLTNVNGTLFFSASNNSFLGGSGTELWRSNGTQAGTMMVANINTVRNTILTDRGSYPAGLTNLNGTLLFTADDGTAGRELWASDGTSAGTFLVADINPGAISSSPMYLTNVRGALFFSADDGTRGREPWVLTVLTPNLLFDVNQGPSDSDPSGFTEVNGLIFFRATDERGNELWVSDGTASGTYLVKDINPGPANTYPSGLTNLNGTLFFSADFELWESNGSRAGTFPVNPGGGGRYASYLTNANGTLFFEGSDGTDGVELWRSNGTAAGTFLVKDINPGSGIYSGGGGEFGYLANVNGTVFFHANDGTHGVELWESNGTAAGTFLVKDINPSTKNPPYGGYYPYDLTNVNGTLFFRAPDGTHGRELWESNGTAAGTFLVKDIHPGQGSINPMYQADLTNVNGTLFFQADDGTHGQELWESNGSAAGTFLVKDINPGANGSKPYVTNVNGTAFFSADDGTHGGELWASNGTAAGTFLVKDINPGPTGSNIFDLVSVNGTAFFSADDGTHGLELWASNGTAAGTFLVQDIHPGSTGSKPLYLYAEKTNVNGALLFSADDGDQFGHGLEPWILPVSRASTTTVTSSPNSSLFGQTLTFTATVDVAPGSPSPTGTVDFKQGATDLTPGGRTLADGQATFTTGALAVGSHVITAVYSSDSVFTDSQGNDALHPQIVNKAGSALSLGAAPGASVFGEPVAFFAFVSAVAPGAGTLTGTVTFKEGSTTLVANVSLSGGQASFSTASLSVGSHTITATYSGTGNFLASGTSRTLVVSKAPTSTMLASTPNPSVFGQAVFCTAVVLARAPSGGTPTGTVDFKEGATDLTPGGIALSGGRVTFFTTSFAVGHHTITAIYNGNANFSASQANDSRAPQVVNQALSRTVLTSFPDPSVFGQVVSFTVLVSALPLGRGTPSGTVSFTDGATTIGSITLTSSRATFTSASLGRGNHAINASYGGDTNFTPSAYTNYGQTVLKAPTTTTATASANPVLVNQALTLTATVQASSPGAGTPTGTVEFIDLTTTLGTGTLNSAGKATFITSTLAVGTHAITASYGGDNNFTGSLSPILAETVRSTNFAALAQRDQGSGVRGQGSEREDGNTGFHVRRAQGASALIPEYAGIAAAQLDQYFADQTRRRPALVTKARRVPTNGDRVWQKPLDWGPASQNRHNAVLACKDIPMSCWPW